MFGAGDGMDSGPEWPRRAGEVFFATAGPRDESVLPSRHRPSAREDSVDRLFPRTRRLRKRRDFLRIQRQYRGKGLDKKLERKSPHFVVILASGPEPECRLGVTVSRKVGSAVQRNAIKRRVREFFRNHRHKLQPAHDLLIIARAGADKLSYRDVESELAQVLGTAID